MIDMEELILGLGVCGLPPSALPGISPTKVEIGKRLYRRFILKH